MKNDPIQSLETLDEQRRAFSSLKTDLLSRYLQKERSHGEDATLLLLNGFGNYSDMFLDSETRLSSRAIAPLVNKRHDIAQEGGYFINLHGQGIVVNPGPNFLSRFHCEGGHLWDIHHIIVTHSHPIDSNDLNEIYNLNKELNAQLRSYDLPPHVIRFYLHPEAFKNLAPILKPSLRQERSSIISLEVYQDSQGVEELPLSNNLTLAYAPIEGSGNLAIKLTSNDGVQIGYLSQAPVGPNTISFFADCSIMVIGVGNVHFEEIAKLEKREDSPGFVGTCELIKGLSQVQLVIITEQSMLEGDIRLELISQIRNDILSKGLQTPTILPSEIGLSINLKEKTIRTPYGLIPTQFNKIRVVRSKGQFSKLTFIDQNSIL